MNNYKKTILSNKAPIFTIPVKGAKTTTALILFKTGSKYETRENSGISHFLEHMFFKGTKKRPNTSVLSGEMDALGGEYNAFTSKEFTGYWFKVANNKLSKALDIMGDMLFNSKFSEEEIEREKGVIIEELNMYEDNPRMHIEDVFESCLYGDTPAGWETIGTKENIRRFKREDFIKYFTTQYGANSVYIILAGAVKPKDKKLVAKIFSEFKDNKPQAKKPVLEQQKSPQLKIALKKTDQAAISLGVRAFSIDNPDEFKLRLLALILGGSMSSRLFISLRERSGLAYYVRTNLELYSDSGYLTTQAGVPSNKVKEATQIILKEYEKIKTELVSAKELKRAKDMLQGRILLQMEATDDIANWYARQALYRKKILTPAELIKSIKKVTPEQIRAVSQKVFTNQRLNLALIGNIKDKDLKSVLKF